MSSIEEQAQRIPAVERVLRALEALGVSTQLRECAESTATARAAAAAIGTGGARIVKLLLFAIGERQPILVLVSGVLIALTGACVVYFKSE